MNGKQMKELAAKYNAKTHGLAFVYPRKNKVNFNGFPGISFSEAEKRIREALSA